ncbi:MAG: lipopolysaccharide kinase InaA family protein [Muribaculaceae bacterium]|nr:lipopolysaccharide kinase InaA family protein [Muribaculaceae bacterium]
MLTIFPDNPPEYVTLTATHGVPPAAVSIYKGRNEVFALQTESGQEVNIKSFHKPRFPNSFIYTNFRQSKARRSYINARRLLSLGFHTPQPIAYVEEKQSGLLRRSYYFCRQVPFRNVRNWTTIPDYKQLIEELGAEMHRLMTKGVFHRDFSPGNILFERLDNGHFRFYYVDLNRMEFNVTSRKKLMRMFRAITLDHEELKPLAAAYARAAGLPVEATVSEALRQLDNYLAQKRRLRKLKSLFKR